MTIPLSAAGYAKHQQRLAWLREHPDLLATLPSLSDDVEPPQSAALELASRQMKSQKLFTERANARDGIRRCVSEIRGQAVATIASY